MMQSLLARRLVPVLLGVLVVGGLATPQATAGTALPHAGLASARHDAATAYGYDAAAHDSSATGDERGFGGTAIRAAAWAAATCLGGSSPPALVFVAAEAGTSALESLSPAVRTNVDDAIQRAASGKVRFPGHDGKVYNNSDGLLPRGGSYTEWTAAQAGAKRGADRVIIDGDPANPNAIYYWDHVNPPTRIGP
jgi:guanyl-specific ribonuclease Sa